MGHHRSIQAKHRNWTLTPFISVLDHPFPCSLSGPNQGQSTPLSLPSANARVGAFTSAPWSSNICSAASSLYRTASQSISSRKEPKPTGRFPLGLEDDLYNIIIKVPSADGGPEGLEGTLFLEKAVHTWVLGAGGRYLHGLLVLQLAKHYHADFGIYVWSKDVHNPHLGSSNHRLEGR